MADVLSELQWLPPLIDAVLTFLAAAFVLARYRLNKLRQSLFWGLGLIVLSIWFFTEFGLHSSLILRSGFTTLFAATVLSIFLVLFYYGCAITVTTKRMYTVLLPSIVLVAEQLLFIYLGFVVSQMGPASAIKTFSFSVPFYVFFGIVFLIDYLSLKRTSSLLITVSWWMTAAIQPLFIMWLFTPQESIYHILRTIAMIILFTGFVILAHSKPIKSR